MSTPEQTEFEKALAASLRQSSEQLPEATVKALDQRRAQALSSRVTKRWQIPSAVAATVLGAVVLINTYTPHSSEPVDDLAYWQVEPDMLETMDMLAMLSEVP